MKQTVFIPLTFTASPVTTATVSVPFKVSLMHVKSLAYKAGTNGTTNYVMLRTSLGLNAPLGILNQDTTYSSGSVNDVEIQFKNPEVIQGDYTFTLFNMDGTLAATSNAGAATDKVGLIIEFNSPDEIL
jgi:hypothetical protein